MIIINNKLIQTINLSFCENMAVNITLKNLDLWISDVYNSFLSKIIEVDDFRSIEDN